MKWYILQVLSGKEKSAKLTLENLKSQFGSLYEENTFIGDILIPEEDTIEIKSGVRKKVKRKILPGYLLIQFDFGIYNEGVVIENKVSVAKDIYNKIVLSSGIGRFIGNKDEYGLPSPVSEDELKGIFNRMGIVQENTGVGKSSLKHEVVNFSIEDRVLVVQGPFHNRRGVVRSLDIEKGKVRVEIDIFGMPTPVELDFLQIEKF